jgi:hypothetical protein
MKIINKMKTEKTSKGFGLGTILFLIFLVLKLTGVGMVATWSWWWVLSPLWIPIVVVLSILLCALAFISLAALIGALIS